MSAEWLTAIGTMGTFVVIAASAIAALVQLRHMRGSNQIVALTECRETLESPEFAEAQYFVSFELAKRLKDPAERTKISQVPFTGEYKQIATVANFFESMGMFVKSGIIDQQLACDFWCYAVVRNWTALAPVITYVRKKVNVPALWENFEYMAVLSDDYMRSHPAGHLPAGTRRMPEDNSLIDFLGERDVT